MAKTAHDTEEDGRDAHARGSLAEEHSHCRIPVGDANRGADARSAWPTSGAIATSIRNWSGAARMSRTGPIWSSAPPLYIQEKVHPKVLIDDLLRQTRRAGTRAARRSSISSPTSMDCPSDDAQDRVLPARCALVEPDDPRRQPAGDGVAGGARRAARQGAVHLHRPALRHQVQFQLPVVHDEPRCEGRQRRSHHARAGAGEGVPGHLARWDPFST